MLALIALEIPDINMKKEKQVRMTELKGLVLGALHMLEAAGKEKVKATDLRKLINKLREPELKKPLEKHNFRNTLKAMHRQGFVSVSYIHEEETQLTFMQCEILDAGRECVPEHFKQN